MLWVLLSCQGEKNTSDCHFTSPVTYDGTIFSLPEESCSSLSLAARVLGTGEFTITFEEIGQGWQPVVTAQTDSVFNGLSLEGAYSLQGTNPTRLWRQGYQSWWWSGVTDLNPIEMDPSTDLPIVGGDGDGTSATEEQPYSSWWNALIGKDQQSALFAGAFASTKTRFWSAFSEDEMWLVWGARGESISLSAGDSIELDPVWIQAGNDPFALHREYATRSAEYHSIEPRQDLPPVGWATWYTFYEDISEEIVLDNLAKAQQLADVDTLEPMHVFQIDDGWQRHWGDWQANDDFPSGMADLATVIQDAGFIPGLWLAPFYVSVETDIYQQQPDWWVRDSTGIPIRFSNLGSGDYVIVDATHPEAGPWMRDQVAVHVQNGWTYLKLDFLYAGAQQGQRFADVTSTEAFHIGMELLQEAVGDHFLLACGAPMLPSLGYADAFRTGADIGFGFDPGPRREYLHWQLRSTAARSWQNQLWWWVDPDQILLREPFSMEELTGALTANIVSGGSWLIGDDLTAVSDARLHVGLSKNTVQFRGVVSEPLRPLQRASLLDLGPVSALSNPDINAPTSYRLSSGHTAYINLSNTDLTLENISGTEHFSGDSATGESRILSPGSAEIWLP